jgi:leucine-rich repeat protein SHOC2
MDAFATSRFALLDARGSLRLITDAVHEDDALCLALTCRALRDALWARFPARPAGHAHAGKRLRTRDAAVARLGAAVTADGALDLSSGHGSDRADRGALPEGVGRLVYLPRPGLRKLNVCYNSAIYGLGTLPEGLCSLAGLEELYMSGCGLTALPQGIGRLVGLRKLALEDNEELTALPASLGELRNLTALGLSGCRGLAMERSILAQAGLLALLAFLRGEAVEGVARLDLDECGLTELPEGIGRLVGLKKLNLYGNTGLTALPEELCALVGLEELYLSFCGLTALPEGIGGLVGLRKLGLYNNEGLTALPAALGGLRNLTTLFLDGCRELTALPAALGDLRVLEELSIDDCPGLADLADRQRRQGLPALLAHLAAWGYE